VLPTKLKFTAMKVLIVENEIQVASFIKKGLEEYNFEVDVALDAKAAKKHMHTQVYGMIILDVNLPKTSGVDLCRSIRKQHPYLPILMLTAMGSTKDKLIGFDAGADDYLVKPFDFQELIARVRALSKRNAALNTDLIQLNMLRMADLEINLDTKAVKRGETKIDLTARELALLEFFVRNQNRALSRAEIASQVWDISFDTGTNVVDVYINYLRKKIDKNFSPKLIHTLAGIGYIMKTGEE